MNLRGPLDGSFSLSHPHSERREVVSFALNIYDLLGVSPDGLLDFFSSSLPSCPAQPKSVPGTLKCGKGHPSRNERYLCICLRVRVCVFVCERERVHNSRRGGKGQVHSRWHALSRLLAVHPITRLAHGPWAVTMCVSVFFFKKEKRFVAKEKNKMGVRKARCNRRIAHAKENTTTDKNTKDAHSSIVTSRTKKLRG